MINNYSGEVLGNVQRLLLAIQALILAPLSVHLGSAIITMVVLHPPSVPPSLPSSSSLPPLPPLPHSFFFFLLLFTLLSCVWETVPCYVAQPDFEVMVLLHHLLGCWESRCVPPDLAFIPSLYIHYFEFFLKGDLSHLPYSFVCNLCIIWAHKC